MREEERVIYLLNGLRDTIDTNGRAIVGRLIDCSEDMASEWEMRNFAKAAVRMLDEAASRPKPWRVNEKQKLREALQGLVTAVSKIKTSDPDVNMAVSYAVETLLETRK